MEMASFNRQYQSLIHELLEPRYLTYQLCEILDKDPSQLGRQVVHVVLRFDVDANPEVCMPLAEDLSDKGINASFYFLTDPRHYNIWDSQVPLFVSKLNFEVGVHSNHYWEQLTLGTNALQRIKEDVQRLSECIGKPVKGMVAHGHKEINKTDRRNSDIYKDINPSDLGLEYHDGTLARNSIVQSAIHIRDYLGIANAWRYWPQYPQHALRRIPRGSVVVLVVHPHNFFEQESLQTNARSIRAIGSHLYHYCRIRLRYQLIGAIIGEGKSAREEFRGMLRLRRRDYQ